MCSVRTAGLSVLPVALNLHGMRSKAGLPDWLFASLGKAFSQLVLVKPPA